MFSISLDIEIPDFDKLNIEIQCPNCDLYTWVKLGDIRRQDYSICRGCYANLLFEDYMGKTHRSLNKYRHLLQNMEF